MPPLSRTVPLTLAFALRAAAAQAPSAPSQPAPVGGDRLSGSFDLGFVHASGNNRFTSLFVTQKAGWTAGRWRATEELGTVYAETEGERSADQWRGVVRLDRALTPRVAVYGLGTWLRDPFAGIADRYEQGAGAAWRPWDTRWNRLLLEAGLSRFQQLPVETARLDFWAARTALDYQYTFGEGRAVRQFLEVLPNLDVRADWLLRSETALQAPLTTRVSVKLAYVVRYDNVPEPGRRAADRTFTSGVQVSF